MKMASAIDQGLPMADIDESLSDHSRSWFLDMGGAAAHVVLSRLAQEDPPAELHVTTTPEIQDWMAQLGTDTSKWSSADRDFMCRQREQLVADSIARADLHGETAYVTFGGAHTFEDVFSATDAPALYRLKDSPPDRRKMRSMAAPRS
jgi:hypothetical protein